MTSFCPMDPVVPSHKSHGPLFMPPRPCQSEEFNFLLKQVPAQCFTDSEREFSVLLFPPNIQIALGPHTTATLTYHLSHPAFLVHDGHAAQLVTPPFRSGRAASTYIGCDEFSLLVEGPQGSLDIALDRKKEQLFLVRQFGPEEYRVHQFQYERTDTFSFCYLPAPPKLVSLLFSDELGYVCFTMDRPGAYPWTENRHVQGTTFRGFQLKSSSWIEFDVHSVILGGGCTGNRDFQCEIGNFFIPGENSVGEPLYSPVEGRSCQTVREFPVTHAKSSIGDLFPSEVERLLREIGLPSIWPPESYLVPKNN